MYNYRVTGVSCRDVIRLCFCGGICFGGITGLIIGFMDKSLGGLFTGMFVGFAFGLFSGILGGIYAAVFNILAPYAGGVAVRIEKSEEPIKEKDPA